MTNPAHLIASPLEHEFERAGQVFDSAAEWLFSSAMEELLTAVAEPSLDSASWLHLNEELPTWVEALARGADTAVDGLPPQHTEQLRRAVEIERAASGAFNFRTRDGSSYRERSQAAVAGFSADTRAHVLALTTELGLVHPVAPRFESYDKTLVLGGGYRSPLLRTRYAAQLKASGVALGEVSFLGSPRFLIDEPPERPVTVEYAPEATDEFGLLIGAVRSEFGLEVAGVRFLCGCASAAHPCPAWQLRGTGKASDTPPEFTHERQAVVAGGDGAVIGSVLSASTGRPPYRPDTSDTLALWARCAAPEPGQRLLLVTTQVFVPFQTFDALRRIYLPFGADVDAVGFGPEWGDRPQTAEYLLQETLSAIRSARRLLIDAAEVLRSTRQ